MNRLAVHDLSFAYNGQNILQYINFSVKAGEILAILGPNGVGKTTLLKCLGTLLRPATGVVLVEEQQVLHMNTKKRAKCIGYVAQKNEVARLTVFDAVLLGRKPHVRFSPDKKDLSIVSSALYQLDLEHLALRHIDQLSGGELQKVCIARAIVQEPELLLLDEPTSALDLKNQAEIMKLIHRIATEHRLSVVLTMHDLNTAFRYADTAILLKKGQIHACTAINKIEASLIEDVYGLRVELHTINHRTVVVPA